MAAIYKHGGRVGVICKLDFNMCFCADGVVLRNQGRGWKRWKRVKPGIDAVQAYADCRADYEAKLRDHWAFAHWRDLVHGAAPLSKRRLLVHAVRDNEASPELLFERCRGLLGLDLGLEECRALTDAYRAAKREAFAKAAPAAFARDLPITSHVESGSCAADPDAAS